ncbi:MAG TPA: metal-dependent transcriptional regulator [Methanolinea sp.]|jgi:Mn-dependent DtxR family transcriptional regulator|nr:metal-dependent transcriptional regulator [Methanolinea sp.]HPC55791.1 metal-dependent transcriptional regulator [Methanolinea sp.]HQE86305.1 metal-dependent transcriptional regulator [Methanolinea sp.]HQI15066.1 metal-dependent transcriptional regulator [Methanolinea sp.]HQJ19492.1 metal-dependent transcriptional regulator [Methanolinea sp.]
MEPDGDDGLSPRKVSYLKFLRERGNAARTGEIAERFSVDPSTVTRAVQELAAAGLVFHQPYGRVTLTEKGVARADFLVWRHRVLGLVLSHYGLAGEEACREAERFEAYVSAGAVRRICASLGHPTRGICGAICHDALCGAEKEEENF